MKRLFANLQKIEDFILVATFTVMVLASFAQVHGLYGTAGNRGRIKGQYTNFHHGYYG